MTGQAIIGKHREEQPLYHSVCSFILAGVLFLLTGCAASGSLDRPVLNKPESRIFDMKPSVVMKAVKQVLEKKKFGLNSDLSGLRHVETEWLREGSYRSKIKADIRPLSHRSSELNVQIFLQHRSVWQKTWQPVDKIGDKVYTEFMDEVQMECYRVMYDGG